MFCRGGQSFLFFIHPSFFVSSFFLVCCCCCCCFGQQQLLFFSLSCSRSLSLNLFSDSHVPTMHSSSSSSLPPFRDPSFQTKKKKQSSCHSMPLLIFSTRTTTFVVEQTPSPKQMIVVSWMETYHQATCLLAHLFYYSSVAALLCT